MKIALALLVALALTGGAGAQEQPFRFTGAACATPPPLHCPDADCPSDRVINQGAVVEMKTRRTYFLDYPCDLKPGEKVTFILSLHGGGSYGNWQRHYFPIMDLKDKHRLVIATPNAPTRAWSAADDEYLQNIVDLRRSSRSAASNIKAFWLAGHSQGGMTSNRLLRTEFFKTRVDGWLSLSGGRLGGSPGARQIRAVGAAAGRTPAAGTAALPPGWRAAAAALRNCRRRTSRSSSRRASARSTRRACRPHRRGPTKYGCGARATPKEIVDSKAGYIYDRSRQNPPNPAWGLLPGPGKANVLIVYRLQGRPRRRRRGASRQGPHRGARAEHHRGAGRLMLSAKGGKLQQTASLRE